jgi:hypothetical protein
MRHIHMFGTLNKASRATDFRGTKMSRLQWCSSSSSSHQMSSLQMGPIRWCSNGLSASVPLETILMASTLLPRAVLKCSLLKQLLYMTKVDLADGLHFMKCTYPSYDSMRNLTKPTRTSHDAEIVMD